MNERPPQVSRDSQHQVDRGCPREAGRIRVEVAARLASERPLGLGERDLAVTVLQALPSRRAPHALQALLLVSVD